MTWINFHKEVKTKRLCKQPECRLNTYLADIDRQAQERFERLIEGMKKHRANGTLKGRKHLKMDRKNE